MSHSTTPPLPPPEPPDLTSFARYLAGESTPAEQRHIDAWAQASPENARWLAHARRALQPDGRLRERWDLEALWGRVVGAPAVSVEERPRIGSGRRLEPAITEQPSATTRRTPAWIARTIAGGTGIAALLGVALLVFGFGHRIASSPAITLRYATGVQELRTVRLPDGSRVTLAPQTVLVLDKEFGKTSRAMTLRGQVYVDAVPDARLPLSIDAGGVRTRVLGTSFAIRRYSRDSTTQIAVEQGRVMVERIDEARHVKPRPGVVLAANMVGIVSDSTMIVEERPNVSPYVVWTNGGLSFEDTPVMQALSAIESWYGVKFVVQDSTIAHQHLTANIKYRNTADMLKALKDILEVSMTFHGDTAVLVARHPESNARQIKSVVDSLSAHPTREVGR